jgi:glycosyltransferase involved in cell wall biosynthesis
VRVHRLRGLASRIPGVSADPVRYTPPPFPDPELVWRLRRLIVDIRPQVVHCYGWLAYSCVVALAGLKIPLVLAAREYAYVCPIRTLVRHGQPCTGPATGKCLECAASFYGLPKAVVAVPGVLGGRRLLRRSTARIHSTSSFTDQMIRDHLTKGTPIRHQIIPDFREDDLTGHADAAVLAKLPTEPYILFVGAFRKIKGVEQLLEAYDRVKQPPPLVLIGARSPESLPVIPPGVTALVDVPHDTVMAAWDGALFGVAPSVVPEALGNVVHEAMSRGKAVIGTYPGGHTDMIDDGKNGLLVPAGDVDALVGAMTKLISDQRLRRRMEAAARERAQAFTAGVVVPKLERLLEWAVLDRD